MLAQVTAFTHSANPRQPGLFMMVRLVKTIKKFFFASDIRAVLVEKYIRGNGIEIGALHSPLNVACADSVHYVDRMPVDELRCHYPELNDVPLTPVDIIDDGEKLNTFQLSSVDFIIANHFIEHAQDPIGTIKRHVDVLKPGGILYMAIPDKRFTFDRLRPSTTFEHFVRDHEEGPAVSYIDHVKEWVRLVDGLTSEKFERKVHDICRINYSIHFHVWNINDVKKFLQDMIIDTYHIPITMLDIAENPARFECICILRKNSSSDWRFFLRRFFAR